MSDHRRFQCLLAAPHAVDEILFFALEPELLIDLAQIDRQQRFRFGVEKAKTAFDPTFVALDGKIGRLRLVDPLQTVGKTILDLEVQQYIPEAVPSGIRALPVDFDRSGSFGVSGPHCTVVQMGPPVRDHPVAVVQVTHPSGACV